MKMYLISDNAVSYTHLDVYKRQVQINGDDMHVIAPTWRSTGDISIKDDVMEEVARMYGYEMCIRDSGSGLMELLKQPLGKPMSLAEKVITLCAARHKVMLGIPTAKVKGFQMDMLSYFASAHPEIAREIEETKDLSKELSQKIVEIAEEFKKSRC